MFIPPNTRTMDKVTDAQFRLGVQGYPGSGKTWAALTAPNPIVVNIDRGLGAHIGRADVIEVPVYDRDFAKTIYPSDPTNTKEVAMLWLRKYGAMLEAGQTLIFDGLTGIESAFHTDWTKNPLYTKQGKIDDFGEWRSKVAYFGELCDIFTTFKCNVMLLTHESEQKDKDGGYTGKIRPLMTGQFADKIVGKFTDWFRQRASSKPKDYSKLTPEALANWGMKTVDEFKAMCDTFERDTIYYWQTSSDDTFDGKASSLVNFPKYIPANYESFRKYCRKISPSVG